MTKSKDEKRRFLHEWKAREHKKAEDAFPAPRAVLLRLFDYLDRQLPVDGCDHTLRLTLAWAAAERLDGEKITSWTRECGGFCDCEVLANVEGSTPALDRGRLH